MKAVLPADELLFFDRKPAALPIYEALENFRQCLMRINSRERYERFLHSGFPVLLRDEDRSIEQTMELAERSFGLV